MNTALLKTVRRAAATLGLLACWGAQAELAPEPLGKIETLPAPYPDHWIIAQDASFFHMNDGKFIVLDPLEPDLPRQFKGMFNGSAIPQMVQAVSKPEMYVAQTFHSMGHRGERSDYVTIYDKATLAPIADIEIPAKRASSMPSQYAIQLTDDEGMALVFNLIPATSVTVVNLEERTVAGEIQIPGCALVYPTGDRGFSSLCADGSMYAVTLDEKGAMDDSKRLKPFFDTDADALFERAAMHKGMAYFPTFLGGLQEIDLSRKWPKLGKRWSLLGDGDEGWRPGGLQLAAADDAGRLYVMMHPDGKEGTHKDPGVEVWVYDTKKRERVQRLPLQLPAITMTVTSGEEPLLVATNVELNVDVYRANTGEFVRTLAGFGQETPLLLHGAK